MLDLIARARRQRPRVRRRRAGRVLRRHDRSPATARSRTARSSSCSTRRAHASRSTRRSATRSTSRSGRRPSRASRRGTRRGGPAAPAGTSSARAMSLDLLGEGFDLHGGGDDLVFPHHENERAQAEARGPRVRPPLDPLRHGRDRRREDVEVARQLHHARRRARRARRRVRSAWPCCRRTTGRAMELGDAELSAAARRGRAPRRARSGGRGPRGSSVDDARRDGTVVDAFRAAMDDDFGTPGAMAAGVFDAGVAANQAIDAGELDRAARPRGDRGRARGCARPRDRRRRPAPTPRSTRWSPRATRPARRATSPRPIASATSSPPGASTLEDTPTGTIWHRS